MAAIEIVKGDITKFQVDAIVNAANSSLMGGGGVDGAIHRAGGPAILQQCREIVAQQGYLPAGEAVATTAGNLPAHLVIHTVGPIWNGGNNGEPFKLNACYTNALRVAVLNGCKTVAFPCISTGVYGYPGEKAASVAIQAIYEFLGSKKEIEKIILVCFDEKNFSALTAAQKAYISSSASH